MTRSLLYFNVSFTNFRAKIPSGGPFENFIGVSFISNEALCDLIGFICHQARNFQVQIRDYYDYIDFNRDNCNCDCLGLWTAIPSYRKIIVLIRNDLPSWETYERVSYSHIMNFCKQLMDIVRAVCFGTEGFGSVYKHTLKDGCSLP